MLSQKNFYNPFVEPYLGFFIGSHPSQQNQTKFTIKDLNLYHQPVPNPQISSFFFAFMSIELFFGFYIHRKILVLLKKEDGILKNITRVFVLAQMIFWPTSIIMITITNFVHPIAAIINQWFCSCIWFLLYFPMNIISTHSFLSASIRYVFIVHYDKVRSLGKEKVKKIFLIFSMLAQLFLTLWKATDGAELDMMSYMNKCFGRFHNVFLVETSALNVAQKTFGFCDIHVHEDLDAYHQMIVLLKQGFCIASTCIMLILGSNVTEGIIYFRLFTIMNRYWFGIKL